ncbi:MAG: hypothetical protein LBK13_01110 [Spirochaetales bacterium]|nr:hypothetical protein [Spirochaetales bacterium]
MTTTALISFVDSEVYNNALKTIIENTGIEIDAVYNGLMQQIEIDELKKTSLSIGDYKNILERNYDGIIRFCIEKIRKYDEDDKNSEDTIPTGKGREYSKGFISMYICEYYLLKEKPGDLLNFIKSRRIEGAEQYENELKKIYKKTQDN